MGAKWFWGIVILAIASIALTLVGPWNIDKRSTEMGDAVKSALGSEGMGFANVDMEGHVATLSGEAASDEAREAALFVAGNARHPGAVDRKWHKVADAMTVVETPPISPYVFSALKTEDGNLTLTGYVADEATRDNVIAAARAGFGDLAVSSAINLGPGQPNASWVDVITSGVAELNVLDRGRLSVEDAQVVINGDAASEDVRDRINNFVSNLPIGYSGAANISVPDVEDVNVGEITSETICQTLLDDLKGDNKINFGYDKAEIRGAASFDLLNSLASAAKQCADFRIRVEGHTDSDGDDTYNQTLSEARANTVVAYLADNTVELERLSASGFGENRPLADNSTPAGKAQNRRIEFIVTRSE